MRKCHLSPSSPFHWMLEWNQFGVTPHTLARWTTIPDWLAAYLHRRSHPVYRILQVVVSTRKLVDSDLRPNLLGPKEHHCHCP